VFRSSADRRPFEHSPAPELGEGMETLDLVRIGADGSPQWTRTWPTPQDNARHAG